MSLMYVAPGILNAVFSAVVYYIQVIWLFYWKMMFSLFGAGFWSLVGTQLCSVSAPDFWQDELTVDAVDSISTVHIR